MRDDAGQGGRCNSRGRGHIDARAGIAHAPAEIACAGGDTGFIGTKDAHVAALTSAAGGISNNSAGIHQGLDQPCLQCLAIDRLRAWRN